MTAHVDHDTLERAVESTGAKALGRYVTPVLLSGCIGLLGFAYQNITASIDAVKQSQDKTSEAVVTMQGDVRVVNTRLNEAVIGQIDDLKKRVDRLEDLQRTETRR